MKKNMILEGLALHFAACSNNDSDINVNNSNELVPVKVHVSGFSVSQEDFPATRAAQNVADYNGVKAVTLAFYSGSTEVLKTTQFRDDASIYDTFGEFECSLPMGSYTMVVIARGQGEGDVFTLTSPTEAAYTGDHSRETFACTQTVNITSTDAVDILRSNNSTLEPSSVKGRYSKYNFKAFTRKGLYMMATCLKSDRAADATVAIVETFDKVQTLKQELLE